MPIDRAQLDKQLTALPDWERWSKRQELQDLANTLNPGERVLTAGTALLVESGKLAVKTWIYAATPDRLVCLLKGGPTGVKKMELKAGDMTAAYTDARLGYHEVIIEGKQGKTILSFLPKDSAVALSSALSSQIMLRHQPVKDDNPLPLLEESVAAQPMAAALAPPAPVEAAPSIIAIPLNDTPNAGADITLRELAAYVEKVQRLEAEMANAKKRLAAIEDVIRRAAARSAATTPAN